MVRPKSLFNFLMRVIGFYAIPSPECMKIVSEEGEYFYRRSDSDAFGGKEQTCGVYIAAAADQIVEVEFEEIAVDCHDGGLVVVSTLSFSMDFLFFLTVGFRL